MEEDVDQVIEAEEAADCSEAAGGLVEVTFLDGLLLTPWPTLVVKSK